MAFNITGPSILPIKKPAPSSGASVAPVGPTAPASTASNDRTGLGIVQATPTGQRSAPTGPANDVGTPSSAPSSSTTGGPLAKFIPGGIYSPHGPPPDLTCPVGQAPTEVPAGSGFWRCAPSTAAPTAPAAPSAPTTGTTGGASAPTSGPDTGLNTGTDAATQRLIDLASAMFAGAGTSGSGGTSGPILTTDATPSTTSSGPSMGAILVMLLIVGGIGYAVYKSHKKKTSGSES